jgi:hypothetical protein
VHIDPAAPEFVVFSIGRSRQPEPDDHPIAAHAHGPADRIGNIGAADVVDVGLSRLKGDDVIMQFPESVEG